MSESHLKANARETVTQCRSRCLCVTGRSPGSQPEQASGSPGALLHLRLAGPTRPAWWFSSSGVGWGGAGEGASLSFQVTLLLPPLVWGPHFENNWAAGKLTNELVGAGAVFESRAFMWLENA